MSVYVDDLIVWGGDDAPQCFRHKASCHMYADTLEELHALAKRIGLKREWFQKHGVVNHYDLTEGRRAHAVKFGAIEQRRREAVDTWKRLREGA